MEGEEEKRKTSIELEMEKYLEEEFKCNQEFLEAGFQVEEMNSAPIDLSLPKRSSAVLMNPIDYSTVASSDLDLSSGSMEQVQKTSSSEQIISSEIVDLSSENTQPSVELVKPVLLEDLQYNSGVVQQNLVDSQSSLDNEHPSSVDAQPSSFDAQSSSAETTPSSVDAQLDSVKTTPSLVDVQHSSLDTKPSSEDAQSSSVDVVVTPSSEIIHLDSVVSTPSSETIHLDPVVSTPNSETIHLDSVVSTPDSKTLSLPSENDTGAETNSHALIIKPNFIVSPVKSLNLSPPNPPSRQRLVSPLRPVPGSLQGEEKDVKVSPLRPAPGSLQGEEKDVKVSPPSKIPSRKNSPSISLTEDLRKLENRLERYISKTGSEAGSETSEISDTSAKSNSSFNSLVNRLHHGQTASTRAKTAENINAGKYKNDPMTVSRSKNDLMTFSRTKADPTARSKPEVPRPKSDVMTTSVRGKDGLSVVEPTQQNGSAVSLKSTGTGSMLKTTLRKMSRFSIGSKVKKDEEFKVPGAPEDRRRSRLETKPGVSNPAVRSKSFKEPEKPVANSRDRNNLYTSSLRRTKKTGETDLTSANQGLAERSATGAHLERVGIRRSISASRGGVRIVKKSRTVQTQLTLDAGLDMDGEDEIQPSTGVVHFQVWLPELLGEDTDPVTTHVETSTEPADDRKNRQLTLENMKLQREIERLKAQSTENELLKKELKNVRVKLEEEQTCRLSIQQDLDRNHERVRGIMAGMDSVEKELETRDQTLNQLQVELERRESIESELQEELTAAGQTIQGQSRELDRSMAAQKTLIQQLQEADAEARELQDFMQAEKNTLADALRESEAEVRRLRGELSGREDVVRRLEEQTSLLVRRAEQRSQELQSARSELTSLKERAREMLLAQGAELSRASLAVSQIYSKLDLHFPGSQCEMEDDEENSSSDSRSEGLELGLELGLEKGRRSSQFLVTPTENLDTLSDFSRAMMSASTGSDTLGDNGTSISSLALAIADRKHSESHGQIGAEQVPSLADQVFQLDLVISKILSTQQQSSTTHQEISRPNLNLEETKIQGENLENLNLEETKNIILEQNKALAQLRNMMESREESLKEMKNKFTKNREILTSNWEQAEEEVRKIDEIYHQTVNRVINTLQDLPEIVETNPNLGNLMRTLLQDDALNSADGVNGNLGVGKTRKSDNALTRSLADETSSNTFLNSRNMSQSLFLDGLVPVGMRTGVCSEPCLAKSPLGSVPSILSSPRIQEEDLNANQSL